MTPDASSTFCANCGASAAPEANYCVSCGQPLQPPQARPGRRGLASVRIIEAEAQPEREPEREPEQATPHTETSLTAPASDERPGALVARLATLAWRQPAVRSVVTTGASAVALSLVWRVAGAALAGGKGRRALLAEAEGLAPMVGDLLRDATPSKRLRRRGRRGEVIEEFVYIRRVFRR
ncbi:MAG TPA: zinc ribbon domain-containing protein [Ktedonobacterales bacterium]